MSLHEEKPLTPGDASPESQNQNLSGGADPAGGETPNPWIGENQGPATTIEAATYPPVQAIPEDLQIGWSWIHFLVFLLFTLINLLVVPSSFMLYYAPHQKMTAEQLQRYLLSKPQVAIGSTIVIYGAILFFLYVTLSLLRGQPFWRALGWRKILAQSARDTQISAGLLFYGLRLVHFCVRLDRGGEAAREHSNRRGIQG